MEEGKSYVPEANFTSLVLTLSSSAWVALGKVADPVSGEIRKDLRGAKLTIDLLMMLREKTRGNLSSDEERLLNAIISDLQGNYAETVFEESKAQKSSEKSSSSGNSGKPLDEARSNEARSNEARSNEVRSNEVASNEAKSNEAKSNEAKSTEARSNKVASNENTSST